MSVLCACIVGASACISQQFWCSHNRNSQHANGPYMYTMYVHIHIMCMLQCTGATAYASVTYMYTHVHVHTHIMCRLQCTDVPCTQPVHRRYLHCTYMNVIMSPAGDSEAGTDTGYYITRLPTMPYTLTGTSDIEMTGQECVPFT